MNWILRFCCGEEPARLSSVKKAQILPKASNKQASELKSLVINESSIQPASIMKMSNFIKKDRYEGEELNGVPHGYGSILYANGDFYRGQWVNGSKQGQGLQIYEELKVQYKGQWQNDEPEGEGTMTEANESYYMGQFKAGKKHGKGVYYDSITKKEFSRIYSNGQLIHQKEIVAVPSKQQQFPTLLLDKERFDSQDLTCFQQDHPSLDQMQVTYLLKYHGLSRLGPMAFISKEVKEWNIKEVLEFLEAIELSPYKEIFYKNKIKGKDLMTLCDQELREDLKMKMGDRKRLLNYIFFLNEIEGTKKHSILGKSPKKTKPHNYKLRSNKELKKVLKSVKNYPVYQISIEERSSESSGNSQKYTTGNKIKMQMYPSDDREYDSEALQKKHSINNSNSLKQSSLEDLIEPKSEQSEEHSPKANMHRMPKNIRKDSKQSIQKNQRSSSSQKNHNRAQNNNHNQNVLHHNAHHNQVVLYHPHGKDLISEQRISHHKDNHPPSHHHNNHKRGSAIKSNQEKSENQSQSEERHKKSIDNSNKSSSSTSSEGLLELQRKRTYDKQSVGHGFSQIRQLYEFLKEHRSLDFLIKEKDIEKLELIGEGGFGKVYRGKYIGQQIAIKDYLKTSQHHHKEDFKKQLKIISDLKHPNIVLYMGMCITTEKYILITEYMQNGSLFDQIHKKHKRFDEKEQLDIAFCIVKGMVYLHNMKKILHRDLKSSNVLMGEDWEVKLCDFGLSGQKKKKKKKGGRVGTYQWMAPEVIRNEDNIEEFSDVYSFGVIIWEMLSLKIPYSGLTEQQIIGLVGYDEEHQLQQPEGNSFLLYIMGKCLKKKPHERPTFMEIQSYFEEEFAAQRSRNG